MKIGGCGAMVSAYSRWMLFDDANQAALRSTVRAHCAEQGPKAIANLAADVDFKSLRKWLSPTGGRDHIRPENYYRLVLTGLRDGWLREERSLYRSFSSFIGRPLPDGGVVSEKPRREHYIAYRYSLKAKGFVLRGSLEVVHESSQISTIEKYVIQAAVAARFSMGTDAIPYDRSGLLFVRDARRYVMLSTKDNETKELQVAFLDVNSSGRVLLGRLSDWHDSFFYANRLYAEATRTPLPPSDILALQPADIPAKVDEYLTQELEDCPYVAAFK